MTQFERTPLQQQQLSPHEAFAKVVSLCGSLIYLEEALALYRMTLGTQLAVEIGAYKGASTCMCDGVIRCRCERQGHREEA